MWDYVKQDKRSWVGSICYKLLLENHNIIWITGVGQKEDTLN